MDIEAVQQLCDTAPFQMTQHAELRRRQRGISIPDIKQAIHSGIIIEDYPDAYPYPASLILGLSQQQKPIHLVCGIGNGVLWIVTAYHPDPDKWETDLKTRKEQ
ncbi:MAG: DUF4258 domain-containing protein [Evtepia sp.]